jgi:hypothetical protein
VKALSIPTMGETAWPTLKEFLAPMVVGHEVTAAANVAELMKSVRASHGESGD